MHTRDCKTISSSKNSKGIYLWSSCFVTFVALYNLKSIQISRLGSAHVQVLRKMTHGDCRKDPTPTNQFLLKYANNDVSRIANSENLSDFIEKQQQKFTANTTRQENSKHSNQLLFRTDKYSKRGLLAQNVLLQTTRQCQVTGQYHAVLPRRVEPQMLV